MANGPTADTFRHVKIDVLASPLVEMRGISKRFPGVVALDKVDLHVGRGEVLALCGENGAGKSTLMKILGGVLAPDEGDVRIEDASVQIRNVHAAERLGIAFIHQELNVLDNLDVAANVFLGREPRTLLWLIDQKRIHAQTEPWLERLGLATSSRARLSSLSLAQQQMVEIAKALSQGSRLIIMDEPTSSLTVRETDRLLEVLGQLRREGVSIIYISHRLGEVVRAADRVVVLRDGKNAGQLERNELDHDRIVRLMVGRELAEYRSTPRAPQPGRFVVHRAKSGRFPTRAVSFSAAAGEILGLAGLVGSGRSELAQAIVGLDPSGSADVQLGGARAQIRSPRDAIKLGIFLVPEDRRGQGLVTAMSVRENVSLPSLTRLSRMGLVRRTEERRLCQEQMTSLAIKSPGADSLVQNLSGGNQQKVVLAKWLAMGPRVLILDEPTRGIDVAAKAEIYRLMRRLADKGTVILMISSDLEEILLASDRVAVMHEGQVTGVLNRLDCNEENIMRLAVGRSVAAARTPSDI